MAKAAAKAARTAPAVPVKKIADNRKARFQFELLEKHEAGIELRGTEVKSLRLGKVNFGDAYATITPALEIWLTGLHISPYPFAHRENHDPLRRRRLLMHKAELLKLRQKVRERGLTLVPVRLYLKRGLVKVEIALARGKKIHDKRESIKQRDLEREMRRPG